jgi:hypothetical protein
MISMISHIWGSCLYEIQPSLAAGLHDEDGEVNVGLLDALVMR